MEKELKEEIAKEVELSRPSCGFRKGCNTECGRCGADRIMTKVLSYLPALVREIGLIVLHEDEVEEFVRNIAEANGYVKLADDQSLPTPYGKVAYESLRAVLSDHKIDISLLDSLVGEAQLTLKDAGWRKVILSKPESYIPKWKKGVSPS